MTFPKTFLVSVFQLYYSHVQCLKLLFIDIEKHDSANSIKLAKNSSAQMIIDFPVFSMTAHSFDGNIYVICLTRN